MEIDIIKAHGSPDSSDSYRG